MFHCSYTINPCGRWYTWQPDVISKYNTILVHNKPKSLSYTANAINKKQHIINIYLLGFLKFKLLNAISIGLYPEGY